MPDYEYICPKCDATMDMPALSDCVICPECGACMQRVYSAFAFTMPVEADDD